LSVEARGWPLRESSARVSRPAAKRKTRSSERRAGSGVKVQVYSQSLSAT
jgi:hypothetical protein